MYKSQGFAALAFLQTSSLPMLVQEEIERMIMTGELPGGCRLNESELSQRFNTSRGPIREALRALEQAGLLRTERNRGMFVSEISIEEAEEIYELREAMEEIIGHRVSRNIKNDGLDRLKAMVGAMRAAAQANELGQYAQLNLQFHETLLETAGSAKLTETYQRLIKELSLFRLRALSGTDGLRLSAEEHQSIIEVIAKRDPELAGQVMRKHVAESRSRMHKSLGRALSVSSRKVFNPLTTKEA